MPTCGSHGRRVLAQVMPGIVVAVTIGGGAGCDVCPPLGPTGQAASYAGVVAAGGVVFHDFPPPPGTTQMDVDVRWTPTDLDLRFVHGDPNCDPIRTTGCRAFTDPIPAGPNTAAAIETIITNQGEMAGPRMRLVLRNLDTTRSASYTLTIAPMRAGCT